MKKIYRNIGRVFITAVVLLLTGCNGFLDFDDPGSVGDGYYDTLEGQERLLTSIYSRYRNVYGTGELQYYGTDMYMAVNESPNEKMFNGYDKSFNALAGVVPGYWEVLYKIVQECNTLLNRCKPEVAGDKYETLVAEATFFRAMAYYYLVETFGDVPLYKEENKGVILKATREKEENVYAFMLEELEKVIDILSPKPGKYGYLNNTAVLHFTGKVYLTRAYKDYYDTKDFNRAAELLDRVIEERNYYMLDRFADVFSEDNQGNAEVIWAVQYGTDKNYNGSGNPQHLLFGFNISALRPEMFGYVQADYSAQQRGYWVIPAVHEWFTDPSIDSRYDATFKREFTINVSTNPGYGKLGLYFPRWNDTSGDEHGAEEFVPFKKDGQYYWYPNSTALAVLQKGSDFMPMVQKFKETKIEWGGKGAREDIVMRVGDTYLLSAEAHLGAGDPVTALDRLNDVRRRAAVDEASRDAMELGSIDIDVILDERGRELLGEHDRWFDLKRTGKLIERATDYNIFVSHYNNLNSNHLVRPIPQDERNKVEGITQNKGY